MAGVTWVEVIGVAQVELRGLSGDAVTTAMNQVKASLQTAAEPAPEALSALVANKSDAHAYWRPRDGNWATIDYQAASGTYTCTLGTIDAATKTKQPTLCTINVRVSEPWNPMGALATDGKATYYVHWGRSTDALTSPAGLGDSERPFAGTIMAVTTS
jgi:hypothetical protein